MSQLDFPSTMYEYISHIFMDEVVTTPHCFRCPQDGTVNPPGSCFFERNKFEFCFRYSAQYLGIFLFKE